MFVMSLSVCSWQVFSRLFLCLQLRPEPTCVVHLNDAPLQGKLLALPAKIRLGPKSSPETNTLAYYEHL